MELNVKIADRIVLINLLEQYGKKGTSLSELNQIYKMFDKLEFKDEERKEINFRIENGAYMWENKDKDGNDLDTDKKVELSEKQVEILNGVLKDKDTKKEFDIQIFKSIERIAGQVGYKIE